MDELEEANEPILIRAGGRKIGDLPEGQTDQNHKEEGKRQAARGPEPYPFPPLDQFDSNEGEECNNADPNVLNVRLGLKQNI